jgi:hypothetical protein
MGRRADNFVKLPKDDVETTANYLTFTYGRGLPTQTIKSMPREGISQWDLLVKLYIFGDRKLDKCIRNAVIKELVRLSILLDKSGINHLMPTSVSRKCLDAPEGSPIRRLIVRLHRRSALKAGRRFLVKSIRFSCLGFLEHSWKRSPAMGQSSLSGADM